MNQTFLPRMGEYLSGRARAWGLTSSGELGTCFVPVQLDSDELYGLDADAMLAITHGIEDLALEKAKGKLIVSFQDLKHFEDHREKYRQLAATIEEVMVLGTGQTPRPENRIQFRNVSHAVLQRFWLVIYQGASEQIMLAGFQLNDTGFIPDKRFLAYYTFEASAIERMLGDIEAILAGEGDVLREFDRVRSVGQALLDLREGFHNEREALAEKLKELRYSGRMAQEFLDQYDVSLERLQQLKQRFATLFQERK